MKVRNTSRHADEKVELMMTPMIDIVFQLLVFFIMTFKIVAPEGDFNIKMPLAAPSQGVPNPDELPPLTVRLTASKDGKLTGVYLNEARMTGFGQLRRRIIGLVGDDTGPGSLAASTEIELDCDYKLRFEYTINAITAVSGEIRNGEIVKLIEKIKFAPPRQGE
ncbi:MAG: biopolymer transporter ExbD [Planctomycetota bacterium]|nr:biopolymer transporter ExbD [Planctomycetota bacterium]